ncbi:MAG: outer membrane protein transport protein [Acidobacteriota bacterium]
MSRRSNRPAIRFISAVAVSALLTGPAFGAGFGIFEQGTKAMGMAGAYTAQADDPSAMFHNVAGLAFQKEQDFAVGLTYIYGADATYQGAAPFPGPSVTAEQETLSAVPPHAYWVRPINDRVTFGLGVNAPFGLTTEWDEDFPGRFVSRRAALRAVDVNPSIAWQASDRLGIGIGLVGRFTDVQLDQHVAAFNPLTLGFADVGVLKLETDLESGFGFNLGLLHKVGEYFSWGLSYRSSVDVDYGGDGVLRQRFTGTPFDTAVAGLLPFDQDLPVEAELEFPQMASLGFAFGLTENVTVETDVNWTGWSSFEELTIDFVNDDLPDTTREQKWDDVFNYRLGIAWDRGQGRQWRFGYVFDETPQPEESVSPLLPDADRNGFTIGYGFEGNKREFDIALMYLDFDERTRARSFAGESDFFGTYQNEAWLLGLTIGF